MAVELVVGLGNPGADYAHTRHNAGFWFADALAARLQASFTHERRFSAEVARARIDDRSVWLLKPQTWMNASGRAVSAFARYYAIEPASMLVAHDELDLPAGSVRVKVGGGHGGHNGLRDVAAAVGSGFARLRIGIGRPPPGSDVTGYVLSRPPAAEREAIAAAIDHAVAFAPALLEGRWSAAMNELHRPPPGA